MSDIPGKLGYDRAEKQITEEQARQRLLRLVDSLAEKAEKADDPTTAQTYAETAAVVFDAARARPKMEDVPPNGG